MSTEVTVEGKVSVALPENSAKGATYPVVFTFTNKSDKAATEVKADLSLLPVEFKLGTNGCTDITLQHKIACEVSGNYTPEVNGPVTLPISLSYTQGDTVHLATNTNVSALVLNGNASKALPQNSLQGVGYPVTLSFTNSSLSVEAQGLSLVKNYPVDFKPTQDTCTNDGAKTTLAANTSCQIDGIFTPTKIGVQTVGATLKYDGDGTDPSATTTTTTALVTINGDTTSKLPRNSTVGKSYPVTFTFTNPDKERTVTNVEFTPTYPPEFTQTANGCNTAEAKGSIPPLGNCQVTGNLIPTSATTPLTVAGALTYSGDGQTANVTTSTTPTIVVVNGEITTPLYKDTAKDFTYPVKFTFKNTNTKQPATDISIIPNYPAAFTETKNTCINTIAATQSCTIEGTFAPTTTGQNVVGVTLNYNGDKQVKLETSTEVLDSTFKADISPELPGHINRGSTSTQAGYNVTFKWTNIGGRPITINQYTIAAANNLSKNDVSNDCDNGKTLQAGESCSYQAYLYRPPNLGAASLNTSMSFKDANGKGHDLAASTSTDVIDGAYIDYRFRIPAPYPGWVEFQLNGQGNPIYGNLWKAGNYQIQACYYGLGDCGPWQPYCNITVTNAGTITTSYVGPGEPQGCCAIYTHDHATSSNAQKLIAGYDTSLTNCNLPF